MKERDSNFELLKIILTLMIIVLHYCNSSMGGLLKEVKIGTINYCLTHLVESICIIAVNIFIIITGYFSCKKKSINISKPIKLYILSIFYGITISGIIIILTKKSINLTLIKTFLITTFSRWFVIIYCILYLLIPYINKLINSLTKKQFEIFIIINIVFFCIWPTFFTNVTNRDAGYGITNFIILYSIGGYIKNYQNSKKSKKLLISIFAITTIITTIFSFISGRAWFYSSIFNLISSISLFELFRGIKIKNNNIINKLSTYTFSVYIIHENSFLAKILYQSIFKSNKYWNSNLMILNLLLTVIGIYIICIIIEYIRQLIFKKIIDDKIEKINYEIKC